MLLDVLEAEQQLARFDERATRLLGAGAASLGPISAVLLRTESASSSQIERITARARQLALVELDGAGLQPAASANARLVTSNVRAMESAIALAHRIDRDSTLAVHRALLGRSDSQSAGRFRNEQVWVGGSNFGPHTADFVPPHHDLVEPAMADLFAYAQRDDIGTLLQAATVHAQFETIHPFTDGNGRTGRVLVHSVLARNGLVTAATAPVSAGLLIDTERYFAALTFYRDGDVEPIVAAFADAAIFAAVRGSQLINDLAEVRSNCSARIRARADSVAHRVNDILVGQPVITVDYVASRTGVSPQATRVAIDRLVADGVVVETTKGGRRARVWQSNEVLAVLDDFAEDLRRLRSRRS